MTKSIYTIGYIIPDGVTYLDENKNLTVADIELDDPFILYDIPDQLKYYQLPDPVHKDEISISQITKGLPINSKENFDTFLKILRNHLSKIEFSNNDGDLSDFLKTTPNLFYFTTIEDATKSLTNLKELQNEYHNALFSNVKSIVPKLDLKTIDLTQLLNKNAIKYHNGDNFETVMEKIFQPQR